MLAKSYSTTYPVKLKPPRITTRSSQSKRKLNPSSNYQKYQPKLSLAISQVHKFGTLVEAARCLTSCHSTSEVINQVLVTALEAIETADSAIFYLYDEDSGFLTVQSAIGFDEAVYAMKTKPGEIMSGKAFASGQANIYHTEVEGLVAGSNISNANDDAFRQAAHGRYPQSALIVPLKLEDNPIGVIVLDNFVKEYAFNNTDLNILQLWANHAAVAIDNARLHEHQKQLVQNLEQTLRIHHNLTSTVLQGHGIDGIAATLGELLQNPVLFFDRNIELQALSHSDLPATLQTDLKQWLAQAFRQPELNHSEATTFRVAETSLFSDVLIANVNVGGAILGWVVALPYLKPFAGVESLALEYAATVFGLEYMKQQAIFEIEVRSKSDLIDDIISDRLPVSLDQRFKYFGIDLETPFVCLYIDVDNFARYIKHQNLTEREVRTIKARLYQKLESLLKAVTPTAFISSKSDALIVFLNVVLPAERRVWRDKLYSITENLHQWVQAVFPPLSVSTAISGFYSGVPAFQTALTETQKVTELYQRLGRTNSILFIEEMGADQVLLELPGSHKSLAFAERTLQPVVDYDTSNHTDLLKTLSIYCDNNRNIADTAKSLATHPNTARYRIERIISLLGTSLKDNNGWFDIELAVRILRLHGKLT